MRKNLQHTAILMCIFLLSSCAPNIIGTWNVVRYETVDGGQKGFELGTSYTIFPNVVFYGKYFKGKDIVADRDAQKLFARVDFFF